MSHDHEGHGHEGCGGGHEHGHHHGAVAGPGDELVTCAVRGNETVKSEAERNGLVRDYEGEQYYFCCQHCVDMFDADPASYAVAAQP